MDKPIIVKNAITDTRSCRTCWYFVYDQRMEDYDMGGCMLFNIWQGNERRCLAVRDDQVCEMHDLAEVRL